MVVDEEIGVILDKTAKYSNITIIISESYGHFLTRRLGLGAAINE